MLDTITKPRRGGNGRPSSIEESYDAARAARATDKLLELLIQRHPNDPEWSKYSSRQIAKPVESIPVPKPTQENPARSEQPHEKPAFEQLVGAETCGAPTIEWVSAQDVITPDPQPKRNPKIEEIQRATAHHYNVRRHDILSSRRTAIIVRPRQVAMYLCKTHTLRSYPEIGRKFGNRDHTTCMWAVSKIGNLVQSDSHLAADIAAIRRLLGVADEAGGAQ